MSQTEHQFSNRPLPGAEIKHIGHLIGLQFHPQLKLDRSKGLEFAKKLADHFEAPRDVNLQDNQWTFLFGSTTACVFRVVVQDSQLTLQADFPTNPLEWFEHRYEFILNEFQKTFTPVMLLSSTAIIRGILPIDGDARIFLTTYVTKMDAGRLSPFGRYVHLFGIRLLMPPFQKIQRPTNGKRKKPKIVGKEDSVVDVKAESLIEDPKKLFLEANYQWPTPKKWDDVAMKEVVGGLDTVSEFLKGRLISFLMADNKMEEE